MGAGEGAGDASADNEVFLFVCFFSISMMCVFFLFFSPSYSSVPAVHLITTIYITVVTTRQCVCVRKAGEELHYYDSG